MRGTLIIFEGIDGSGTTTQADVLAQQFAKQGLPAHVTAQPSKGPIGMLIRQVLSGRLVTVFNKQLGWPTMALLFASDRQDQQENEIEPNLRDSINVICDRYVQSSAIYQGASISGEHVTDWILEINKRIRKPDIIFYLKISPEVAEQRRKSRNEAAEIYDAAEFQKKLVTGYNQLTKIFPDLHIIEIDAEKSIEDISEEVWLHVETFRAQGSLV